MHPGVSTWRALVALIVLAASLAIVGVPPAHALTARNFTPRFATNTNGAIDIFGNSQVTCQTAAPNCTGARSGISSLNNNSFAMVAIDADADGSTSNSTMSTVSYPADAVVRFAGLYWGSCNNNLATRGTAKLKVPGAASYSTVTASVVDTANGTYQSFRDVTAMVAAAGPGDYWFADMAVCTGGGAHSGWSLVVVWEHPSQPMRNLTVFDGYGQVTTNSAADRVLNIPVSGFLTPPAGPVNVEVGMVSYEGDGDTLGDGLFLDATPDGNVTLNATDGVALRNPTPNGVLPPATCTPIAQGTCNAFNSTITDQGMIATASNPNHANTLGFDIDEVSANGILPNSSTSMELTLTTSGDFYYPGVVTTAVDLYAPEFPVTTKTVVDLNGGDARPGDVLEYTLTVLNVGQDAAINSVITDVIPPNTTFVPGSIDYILGPNLGAKTDGAGDDQAEFDAGLNLVRFRVGTGATASAGGSIGIGERQTVKFRVAIGSASAGTNVSNRYRLDYTALTIGQPFSYNSNVVTTPVPQVADVSITKSASPSPVTAGVLITYTLHVANEGPSSAADVVVTDTLPTGLTLVSAPASCSGTTTLTCTVGTMASGASTDLVITALTSATLDPDTLLVNAASVQTSTFDPDPTDNATSIGSPVVTAADLAIQKSVSPDPLVAGASATYTLTLTNMGPSIARDVVVIDDLPPEVTYTGYSASTGVCSESGSYVECLIGDVVPGATVTISIDVQVAPTATGSIHNVTKTGSSTPDPDGTNNYDEIDTPVTQSADLSIVKVAETSPIVPGTPARWTLVVTNGGPSDATNVAITDVAGTGVAFTNASATLGNCTFDASQVACSVASLPAGSSVTVTIDGDVDPALPDGSTLDNTATVSSDTPDADPSDDQDSSATPVEARATLELVKEANPAAVVAGQPVTYTLTVRNLGPSVADPVTVTDAVPAGTTFASSNDCTHALGTVTCTVGALTVGSTSAVSFTVDTDPALSPPLTNTATASSPMSSPVEATVISDVVAHADLEVHKSAAGPVVAGQPVIWLITVTNRGPSTASTVSVDDTVPAGMTPASATTAGGSCTVIAADVRCSYPTLAAGQTRTITLVTASDPSLPAGPIGNTASASAVTPGDLTPSNNASTGVVDIGRRASVDIQKTGPATVIAGQAIEWSITVRNGGPSSAESVSVADLLPAGVTFEPSESDPRCSGGPLVSCALGDLPPSGSVSFIIVGDVDPSVLAATMLSNSAQVSTITPDDDPADNSDVADTEVVAEADLRLDKSVTAPIVAGDNVTWTLTLTNAGPSDAQNFVVSDTLPAGVVPAAATSVHPSVTCSISGQDVACQSSTLPAGSSVIITVDADVDAALPAGSTLTNEASVTSDSPDPDPVNNDDAATATVATAADLSLTKTADGATVVAGEVASWTITVANNGPSSAQNVVVADTLPVGVTLIDAVPSTGSCAGAVCSLGTLADGDAVTITVRVQFPPTAADGTMLTNVASVASDTDDPDDANDSDSEDIAVTTAADLVIDKNHAAGGAVAGTSTGWVITVANNGPSDARNVLVNDVMPAGVSGVAMSSADGACTATACTFGVIAPGRVVTIVVSGDIDASVEHNSVLTNAATVSAETFDPDPSNDADQADVRISAVADLVVVKSAIGTVLAGQPAQWQIAVRNDGPSTSTAVTVTDSAPPGVTFTAVSGSPACSIVAGSVACTFASLAPGASVMLTVDGDVAAWATGAVTNTASITSPITDPDPTDNQSTSVSPVSGLADLQVTKTLDTPLVAGNPVSWTVTVVNAGPSVARSVELADPVPASVSAVSATPTSGSCTVGATVSCTLGDIDLLQTATVTITGVLDELIDPATLVINTATATSATPDSDLVNNVASVAAPATTSADLDIIKSLDTSPVVAGEAVTWTITVHNAGPSSARDVQVSDALPSSLTANTITAAASAGSCSVVGHSLSCQLGTVAGGSFETITVTGTVDQATSGSLVNSASVGSTTPDPDPSNNAHSTSGPVTTAADLSVTKAAVPATLTAGLPVTYTIVVSNRGPSVARAVVVDDALPAGLSLTSAMPTLGSCSGTSCSLGDLPAGASATVTIIADVDAGVADGASITNTASVTSATPDPDPGNDTDSVSNDVNRVADLVLAKVSTATGWVAGSPATFELTVTNLGPSASGPITVADAFPGTPFTGGSGGPGCIGTWPADVVCTGASLAAGASTVFVVSTTTDGAATTVSPNAAMVTQVGAADPDFTNNTAASTLRFATSADVEVVKSADAPSAVAGSPTSFTITVTNHGPSTARDVEVTENLPAGFTMVSFGGCGAVSSCSLGDIAVGGSVVLTVVADTDPDLSFGLVLNEATAASTTTDPTASNNTGYAPLDVSRDADISVVKTALAPSVVAGEPIAWTVEVTNAGPSSATDVTVSDMLPAGFQFDPVASDGRCSAAGALVTCDLGQVAPNGTITFVIGTTVDPATPVSTVTNAVTASATTPDGDPSDNGGGDDVAVARRADLSVTKSPVGAFLAGTVATWEITVTNAGPSTATDAALVDTFPSGFTGTGSVSASAGTCVATPSEVICEFPVVAVGETVHVLVQGLIDADATGALTNAATIGATEPEPTPGDNTAASTAEIMVEADIAISKMPATPAVNAGAGAAWIITVVNRGPATAVGVAVQDPNPLGFVATSATAPCLVDPSGVACAIGDLAPGQVVALTVTGTIVADRVDDVTNVATVTSTTPDSAPGDNADSGVADVNTVADLRITKAAAEQPVSNGDVMTWTISVVNLGPSLARSVVVSDPAPIGFAPGQATTSLGTCAVDSAGVRCAASSLPVGQRIDITVTGRTTASGTLINTANVVSDATDPSPNDATATAQVDPVARLEVTKVANARSATVGQPVEWTIEVINRGPDRAHNVLVSEQIGAGLTYVQASASAGTFDSESRTWSIPDLASGASAQLRLTTTVGREGTVTNTVVVAADDLDRSIAPPQTSASVVGLAPTRTSTPSPTTGTLPHTGIELVRMLLLSMILVVTGCAVMVGRRRGVRR